MSEWIKALESMKEQLFNANHDLGRTIATQAAYIAELREALDYEHRKHLDMAYAGPDHGVKNENCAVCKLLAKPAP